MASAPGDGSNAQVSIGELEQQEIELRKKTAELEKALREGPIIPLIPGVPGAHIRRRSGVPDLIALVVAEQQLHDVVQQRLQLTAPPAVNPTPPSRRTTGPNMSPLWNADP